MFLHENITCWQGMHIFHAVCGIVGFLLMCFFTLFFGSFYFDGMLDDTKINSKRNNRFLLVLQIYIIFLVIFFNFLGK